MAYCTQDDILKQLDEDVLIQLTDDAGFGSVDDDKVDRAIEMADEEIDSYLSVRYSLPFDTVPNRVRDLSVDIAIYKLYGRRDAETPEKRVTTYKDAIAFLEKIAAEKANLDVPDPADDDDSGIGVTTSKDDRVFTTGRTSDSSTGSLDNY